jgi:hypothetical protein
MDNRWNGPWQRPLTAKAFLSPKLIDTWKSTNRFSYVEKHDFTRQKSTRGSMSPAPKTMDDVQWRGCTGRKEGSTVRTSTYLGYVRRGFHSQRSTRPNRTLSVVLACEIRKLHSRRKQLCCESVMVSSLAGSASSNLSHADPNVPVRHRRLVPARVTRAGKRNPMHVDTLQV